MSIVSIAVITVLVVIFVNGNVVKWLADHNRPYDPQTTRVMMAVKATFPSLCRGNSLIVWPEAQTDFWNVRCDPNPVYIMDPDAPLLTVNVTTCKVVLRSLTLMSDYPELQKVSVLANCPLQ